MDTLIYLASKSPRRREILSNLGWEPVVLADPKAPRGWFAGDEEEKPGETPEDYVLRTAVVELMESLAIVRRRKLFCEACRDARTKCVPQWRWGLAAPNGIRWW